MIKAENKSSENKSNEIFLVCEKKKEKDKNSYIMKIIKWKK